jgi:hypothetical protein
MTQEEKKLLYKDLSARQPYRPFICFAGKITVPFLDIIASTDGNELMSINGLNPKDIKPYLRPLSSMTEDERNEWMDITHAQEWLIIGNLDKATDWLNAHHFDYRNLIGKGLALEAPDGMYDR